MINVAISDDGMSFRDLKSIYVDNSRSLRYMLPVFRHVFNIPYHEEFSMFYVIPSVMAEEQEEENRIQSVQFLSMLHPSYFSSSNWITTKRSLKHQNFNPTTAVLVLFPTSNLYKVSLDMLEYTEKKGSLYFNVPKDKKASNNLIASNWSAKQKRYVVLKDLFLLIYRDKEVYIYILLLQRH